LQKAAVHFDEVKMKFTPGMLMEVAGAKIIEGNTDPHVFI
jgi:hypothetical protein